MDIRSKGYKLIAVLRMLTRGRGRDTAQAGKVLQRELYVMDQAGQPSNWGQGVGERNGVGSVRNQRRDVAREMGSDC